MQTVIPTDLYVGGAVVAKSFVPPAGSITDASVQASANIQATKLQHQHQPAYRQPSTQAAANDQQVVHVTYGATGVVVAFAAAAVTPAIGADTVTVDLWKNGSSILSAPITLNNTDTARTVVWATLASTSSVVGDVFEVKVTTNHTSGTLPAGVFAELVIQELPL